MATLRGSADQPTAISSQRKDDMRDARRGPRRVAKEREAALEDDLIYRLEILYQDMDAAYHAAAREGSFSCQGCDGAACCTVDLAIHTYAEMAYLRLGFHELPRAIKTEMGERARLTVLAKDCAPLGDEYRSAVCAANVEGQCVLYRHRPMICRLAGIPYTATRPDNTIIRGPGCKRFEQEVATTRPRLVLDRSPFYRRMSEIELDAASCRRCRTPRQTIAELIYRAAQGF